MKHFQNSAKSTSSFNDTLAIFSMKKVDLITFCPTRMSYLLDSCLKLNYLYHFVTSLLQLASKKTKLILFLHQNKNLSCIFLLVFNQSLTNIYLKAVDKDEQIITNIFGLDKGLADHISQEFECTKLKSFVEGLSVDDKGNLVCSINANNDKQPYN